MVKIKIVKTPPGFPPEWVRKAWVGMTLVSIGREGEVQAFEHPHHEHEFEAYRDGNENAGGYQVRAHYAVYELREHNADAYEWWTRYFSSATAMSSVLVFSTDVCEVVE